jgi:predicted methyltransferase
MATQMTQIPVISAFEAAVMLMAKKAGTSPCVTSVDLGRKKIEASFDGEGVTLADVRLNWQQVEQISRREHVCFEIIDGDLIPIREYSEETRRYYSLYATGTTPTMLISGIPMHRIKNTDPWRDTEAKIAATKPISGRVLDTATGLGYTAILAAATASVVVTIELDPAASAVAARNPYSVELFENPKIERRFGDSFNEIMTFPAESFDTILHDPPTMSLGGQLYSSTFYSRAYAVLRRGGLMFHYIGDPDSRTGASVTAGVRRRLLEAGFSRVVPQPAAFGVTAYK